MARQLGTYTLSSNIEMNAGAPLDARDIVPAKSDLTTSGAFPYAYIGMETYVVAENKKYRLVGADYTDISNWEEVGSGGDAEFVEISWDDYQELTTEEKNDPTKEYFVPDYPTTGGNFDIVELSEAEYNALTPEEKEDPSKLYFRPNANGLFRNVQDDGTATAFVEDAIPTGRTATSVINEILSDSSDVIEGYYVNDTHLYVKGVQIIPGYLYGNTFYADEEHTIIIPVTDGIKYCDKPSLKFYIYVSELYTFVEISAPELIVGTDSKLYIDLNTNSTYRYDETTNKYVLTSSSGSGGSDIEPNPAGTATTDLTKVGIDGTVYGIKDGNALPKDDTFIAVTEAQYEELTSQQKLDPTKVYFRYEVTDLGYNVQDNLTDAAMVDGTIPTGRTVKKHISNEVLQVVTEQEYSSLTTEEKNDPEKIYFRPGAAALGYPVQSDASATDLTNGALPTGQTIKSYLSTRIGNLIFTVQTHIAFTFTNSKSSAGVDVAPYVPNGDYSKLVAIIGTGTGIVCTVGTNTNKSVMFAMYHENANNTFYFNLIFITTP